MKYIVENWFVIVGLIAVLTAGGYAVYVFVKMPSDKQLNKVREWLLYAVTKAEKELAKKYKADYERNKKSQPEYSEKTCTGIRDAIKAGICSDANKK